MGWTEQGHWKQTILHSDLASASRDVWVLGTSVFQITMPHVNFDSSQGVIDYFTSGREIRASDLSRPGLDRRQFGHVTRAGYDMFVIQVIHLNSSYGNKRLTARKALRATYVFGATFSASIICGDFNGAAYRSSTDPQVDLKLADQIYYSQSLMAVEEFQFLIDSTNKGLPLEQRVGLQFRNANPIPATHCRPSLGELERPSWAETQGMA